MIEALERLQQAGASVVVPEALEGSLMLASQTLALAGVPLRRVLRLVQDQRMARYGLMRGYFHGSDDDGLEEAQVQRLANHTLDESAPCVGLSLARGVTPHLDSVTVVSVRRATGQVLAPHEGLIMLAGDTLVLSGRPQSLATCIQALQVPNP